MVAFLLTFVLVGIADAEDPNSYIATGSTVISQPSDDPNSVWKKIKPDPCETQVDVKAGHKIFIAMLNTISGTLGKTWTVKITVTSGLSDEDRRKVFEGNVYTEIPGGSKGWKKCSSGVKPEGNNPYTYKVSYENMQPPLERIVFSNTTGHDLSFKCKISVKSSGCVKKKPKSESRTGFDMRYGSVNAGGDVSMTEIWVCPLNYTVDSVFPPECNMPAGSGGWSYSIENYDPNGEFRPNKVVKYTSDGNGIGIEQDFYFEFSMLGGIDDMYDLYSYNAASGEYEELLLYTGPMPEVNEIKSYADHGVSEFGIVIDPNGMNVEPRLAGITKLTLESVLELDTSTAAELNNVLVTPAGDIALNSNVTYHISGPNNRRLTLEFDPALTDGYCYAVDVSRIRTACGFILSDAVFPVRSLVGDVTRDGYVSQDDVNEVDTYLWQSVSPQNAHCDINGDGYIDTDDRSQVQSRIGNSVRQCVGTCGDADHPYPQGDIDLDCDVDFIDFALMAENWLSDKYGWPETYY
ncbi:MAG: hypothetical protein JW749_00535 [Sedimentisphaerales bacterium]|nr:hypothetical protein [Sedimentisphaerales bacterium]